MKISETYLRNVIRKTLLENIMISEEPPYMKDNQSGVNRVTSEWSQWFFKELEKFPWMYMPTQKRWQDDGPGYSFSKSDNNHAILKYGHFRMQWQKYRYNSIALMVVPTTGYGQKPGIYINFALKSGGTRDLYSQSTAELYFPFKNYQPSPSQVISAKEILEELSYISEEIEECFRILLPAGNKSVKSMPPSVFYTRIWPKIEKYASEHGKEAAEWSMHHGN